MARTPAFRDAALPSGARPSREEPGRHVSPIRETGARRGRERQVGRVSGRAVVLDGTSSPPAATDAADAGGPASATVNRGNMAAGPR